MILYKRKYERYLLLGIAGRNKNGELIPNPFLNY